MCLFLEQLSQRDSGTAVNRHVLGMAKGPSQIRSHLAIKTTNLWPMPMLGLAAMVVKHILALISSHGQLTTHFPTDLRAFSSKAMLRISGVVLAISWISRVILSETRP
jgi:hypothetical protein